MRLHVSWVTAILPFVTETRRCDNDVKAADSAAPVVLPPISEDMTIRELLTVGGLRRMSVPEMFAEDQA